MKKQHLLASLFFAYGLSCQAQHFCGQALVTENWLAKHPEQQRSVQENAKQLETSDQLQPWTNRPSSAAGYTIPVVFHILHLGGTENISDAQVLDQIAILNRDYQKKNADTLNVVAGYTNNIANVGIAFQLATIDPNGNCTNGIIRHYSPNTLWDANNLSLFEYTWPRDKYLNIYVVRAINIAPAYSFLPSVPVIDSADVVVSQHNLIGSIGTSNVANSRAITHEVGHWLNLAHIWGVSNSPGVACGDDGVSDTPITKGFTTCTPLTAAVCNPSIQENYQNYMDYAPCKIMFTNGQANRMITCLTGNTNNRKNLFSAPNLLATGVSSPLSNCSPSLEIAPVQSRTLCSGQSLVIKSYTYNGTASSYSWTASSGVLLSGNANSSVTVTPQSPGNYTITCIATGPGGTGSGSVVITALPTMVMQPGNYFESFEGGGYPNNWQFLDPTDTGNSYWSVTSDASSDGLSSAFVNAELAVGGTVESLETPSYDFLHNPGATYSFNYAYARKNAIFNDLLTVQASRDCGGSWKDVVSFNSVQLAQGSGGISSNLFIPGPGEWKTFVLSDHPNFFEYQQADNVKFRFRFQEDTAGFGNRIYLDEINLDSPVGLNEYAQGFHIELMPNPVMNKLLISFHQQVGTSVRLAMLDLSGKVVLTKNVFGSSGPNNLELDQLDQYPKGMYFIKISFNGYDVTRKLVIS